MKNFKIAYIDDTYTNLLLVSTILEEANPNWEVRIISCPETFLKMEKVDEYNLIITDSHMPRMSGLELAKKLRRENIKAPIIICSMDCYDDNFRLNALEYVNDFLTKPISHKEILSIVNKWYEKQVSIF